MKWFITGNGWLFSADNGRRPDEGAITIEQFEILTGKKINWNIRKEKYITTDRHKGHLKLYDNQFVIGQTYKRNYITYKCEHVDQDGIALLVPNKSTALKAISAYNAMDWEIT